MSWIFTQEWPIRAGEGDSMRKSAFALAALLGLLVGISGCSAIDESPVGKGVKTYERYSDEIGREKDVKVLGKDVIIEPEADKKIRINF